MARNNVGNKIWTARKLPRFGWAITAAALATAMLLGLRPGVYAQSSPLTIQPSTSSVGVNNTDPQSSLDVTGTANVTGAVTVGNTVTATQFIGDGSQLTNLPSSGGITALDKVTSDVSVGNITTETVVYSKSIPGGTLGPNNMLRLTLLTKGRNGAADEFGTYGSVTVRLKYGATTLLVLNGWNPGSATTYMPGSWQFILAGDGATNAQLAYHILNWAARGTSAEDSSVAKTLQVTAQWDGINGANQSFVLEYAILELLQ